VAAPSSFAAATRYGFLTGVTLPFSSTWNFGPAALSRSGSSGFFAGATVGTAVGAAAGAGVTAGAALGAGAAGVAARGVLSAATAGAAGRAAVSGADDVPALAGAFSPPHAVMATAADRTAMRIIATSPQAA
jgi:hypothetical protein